jgi:multisubunit Na+/H+ antiporter MnhB subunit
MQVNPYESPRAIEEGVRVRTREIPLDPTLISVIVVPLAGIVGAAVFVGIMAAMHGLRDPDFAFQAALTIGIAAVFIVLIAAGFFTQPRRPAFASAVIGMLLASPIAYMIAFAFGLLAYDLGTQNRPGAALMGYLCFGSFFLTLSLGGWLGICLTRGFAISKNQVSN